MTKTTPSGGSGTPSGKRDIQVEILKAVAAPLALAALHEATKLAKAMADRRGKPRSRNEAIYRDVYKVRVIGETALSLDNESVRDERQHMVEEAVGLRDALHEQLPSLRLSSAAQKSGLLDAVQTAVGDIDRLVAAMSKWAVKSSDESESLSLQRAVGALRASEDALLTRVHRTHRRRSWRRGEETTADGKPDGERETAEG